MVDLRILREMTIRIADTPLSVRDALWKNISWGVLNQDSDIVPAAKKAFNSSSSMVGNPGFLGIAHTRDCQWLVVKAPIYIASPLHPQIVLATK